MRIGVSALAFLALTVGAFGAVPATERDALVTLYQATGGPSWSRAANWLGPPGSECTWEGVVCNDEESSVISLELFDNHLSGTIPPSFYRLPNLTTLYLGVNDVAGEFADLRAFPALRELDLSLTKYGRGPFPIALTELSELRRLGLANLQLTGALPPELRLLTKLEALYAEDNSLSGTLPIELTLLPELRELSLYRNQLEGSIPPAFSNLANLEVLLLGGNRLEGPFPSHLLSLTRLQTLEFGDNLFAGPLPAGFSNLQRLNYLSIPGNRFSGQLPAELFELPEILSIELDRNLLEGPLPANLASAETLQYLSVSENFLSGEIPAAIGALPSLLGLYLSGNRFTGVVPPQIAQLPKLEALHLSSNALRGPLPPALMGMTSLLDGASDFHYNLFFTTDPALRTFINAKQYDHDFELTQTVPPTDFQILSTRGRSAVFTWKPISYFYDEGGYQIIASKSPGGAPVASITTIDKFQTTATLEGLEPQTQYFFRIRTLTFAHEFQKTLLASEFAPENSAITTADTPAPPLIVVTEPPTGMMQSGAVIEKDDYFALTNFGETITTLTLSRTGSFFEIAELTFDVAPAETHYVSLVPLPQPPGVYEGSVSIAGSGVPQGTRIPVTLLSAAASGDVIVRASTTRIDVGDEGAGSVIFTNEGDAPLAGLLSVDEPWIKLNAGSLNIAPGASLRADFTIDSASRPDGASPVGSVSGNLTLLYLDGDTASKNELRAGKAVSAVGGVAATPVQVVHTVAPRPVPGEIPPAGAEEILQIIPGIVHGTRGARALLSDVFIANASESVPLNNVTLHFVQAGVAQSLRTSLSVEPSQSVQFGDVVRAFTRDDAVGSLIVRTDRTSELSSGARLVSASGTGGESAVRIPVFQSDRGARAGERIALAGVAKDPFFRTDLFIQEAFGRAASVRVEFFDSAGTAVGSPRPADAIAPFGLIQIEDAAPQGAVSALVTNLAGSEGGIVAYALVTDTRTGDGSVVTDWSRYFDVENGAPTRVPLVTTAKSSARRRPVIRGVASKVDADADATTSVTDVVIFNPEEVEASGRIRFIESGGQEYEQQLNLGPRASLVIRDAAATLVKSARSATGQLVVEPGDGSFAVSARRYRNSSSGTTGSEVPVLEAYSGLRAGQSRLFPSVSDSAPSSVAGKQAGTPRADLVIAESDGQPLIIRVRVLYRTGRAAYATLQSKDFSVGAQRIVSIPNVTAEVIGANRERLGTLLNVQLEVEVLSGDGAATILLITSDNGSSDEMIRLN